VSAMTKSLHMHYSLQEIREERMTEEMGLQMFPENRYWRCRRDVQRQCSTVGQQRPEKLDRRYGWKTGASDNKRWCRCRAETLTSLVSRWLGELSGVGILYKNSQLKLYALRKLVWDGDSVSY